MPYFFASLKIAITQAFVGTVLAETVAGNRGIGNFMLIASSTLDAAGVRGAADPRRDGVGLYVIFSLIEMRVTGWARRKELTVA
jgi:NitT/TauT family transport system permease protein